MTDASAVLTAMKFDREYRLDDIAAVTNLSKDRVRVVLNLAVKGGVVEAIPSEKFKRNRVYKSKQRDFGW